MVIDSNFFLKKKSFCKQTNRKVSGKKRVIIIIISICNFFLNKQKIFLHPFIHKYRDYIGIFRFSPLVCFVLFDNLYNNKFKKMMIEHQHHPNHYYHHHHPDDEVGNLSIFLSFFWGHMFCLNMHPSFV